MLDRRTLEDHLAQAERHIASGWAHVERQRALVACLEADSHDTVMARNLLRQFVGELASHVADRDRILTELCNSPRH